MADKVVLTDVSKLRPELLEKSQAELERQMAELQMALAYKAEEGARKAREAKIADASRHIDNVLDGLKWLNENDFLSDKVKAMFTTTGGSFAAHLFFKKPKA